MRTIELRIPVTTFVINAFFAPQHVRVAAQKILRDYDTYRSLYVHSVDIYNTSYYTVFNLNFSDYNTPVHPNFSNYFNTPVLHTLHVFTDRSLISDYDFRQIRNYFKKIIPR